MSKVKKTVSLVLAVLMLISVCPFSAFALNNPDGSAYVEGRDYTYGTHVIKPATEIKASTDGTTEILRLADARYSFLYGNKVVYATPSGVPEHEGGFQWANYANEEPVVPVVKLKITGTNQPSAISNLAINAEGLSNSSWSLGSPVTGTENGQPFIQYTWSLTNPGTASASGPDQNITYKLSYQFEGKSYEQYAYSHTEYILHPSGVQFYHKANHNSSELIRLSVLTVLQSANMKPGFAAGQASITRAFINGVNANAADAGDQKSILGMGADGVSTGVDGYVMATSDANNHSILVTYADNNRSLWSNYTGGYDARLFSTSATDGNRAVATVWVDKATDFIGNNGYASATKDYAGNNRNNLNMRYTMKVGEYKSFWAMWVYRFQIMGNTGYSSATYSGADMTAVNTDQWTVDTTGKSANGGNATAKANLINLKNAATTADYKSGNVGYLNDRDIFGTPNPNVPDDQQTHAYMRFDFGGYGPTASQAAAGNCWTIYWHIISNKGSGSTLTTSNIESGDRFGGASQQSVRFRVYDTSALRKIIYFVENGVSMEGADSLTLTYGGTYGSSVGSASHPINESKGANLQSRNYSTTQWNNFYEAYATAKQYIAAFDLNLTNHSFTQLTSLTAGIEQTAIDTAANALVAAYNALPSESTGTITVKHHLNDGTQVAPDEVFYGLDASGNPTKVQANVVTPFNSGTSFTLRALASIKGYEVSGPDTFTGYATFSSAGTTLYSNTNQAQGDSWTFYYVPAQQNLKIHPNNSYVGLYITPVDSFANPDFATIKNEIGGKEHYNYVGMYENAGLTGSAINESTWTMPNADADLYVKWEPKAIKLHINAVDNNGGAVALSSSAYSAAVTPAVADGQLQAVTFSEPATPVSADGFDFIEFYSDADCTQAIEWPIAASYAEDSAYVITETGATENTIEIYAKFVNLNNIMFFEPQGGTMPEGYESGEVHFETGSAMGYPVPTKAGYHFGGWVDENDYPINSAYISGTFTGAWTNLVDGEYAPVEGGTITMNTAKGFTAYAKWIPNDVTVSFNLAIPSSETSSMNSKPSQYQSYVVANGADQVSSVNDMPAKPRRFGFTFQYWSFDNRVFNFGTTKYPTEGDCELTAVWKTANDVAFAELTSYVRNAGTDYVVDEQHGATRDAAKGDTVSVRFLVRGNFYSGSQSYIFGYDQDFFETIPGVSVFEANGNNSYIKATAAELNTVETFNSAVAGALNYTDPYQGTTVNAKYVQVTIDPDISQMAEYKTVSLNDDAYIIELHLKIKDTATGLGSVWVATETLRTTDNLMGDTFISYSATADSLTNVKTDEVKFDTDSVVTTIRIDEDIVYNDYTITVQLPAGEGTFADGTTAAKTYTGREGAEILEPYTAADGTNAYGFPAPSRTGYTVGGWYAVNADGTLDKTDEWIPGYYATAEQNGKTYQAEWVADSFVLTFYEKDFTTVRGTVDVVYDQVGVTPVRYNSGASEQVLGWVPAGAEKTEENLVDFTTYRVTGDASFDPWVKGAQKNIVVNAVNAEGDVVGSVTLTKDIQTALGLELRVDDTLIIVSEMPLTIQKGAQYLLASDVEALMKGTFTYTDADGKTVTPAAGLGNAKDKYDALGTDLPVSLTVVAADADNEVNVKYQGAIVTETFMAGYATKNISASEFEYVQAGYNGGYSYTVTEVIVNPDEVEYGEAPIYTTVYQWTVEGRYGETYDWDTVTAGVVIPFGYTINGWSGGTARQQGVFNGNTYMPDYVAKSVSVTFIDGDGVTPVTSSNPANPVSRNFATGTFSRTNFTNLGRGVTAKAGYTFDGWNVATLVDGVYTAANSTLYAANTAYINAIDQTLFTEDAEGNLSLYFVAHYAPNTYNVIYMGVPSDGALEAQTIATKKATYNAAYTIGADVTVPTVAGYTVKSVDGEVAWYETADGTGTPVKAGTVVDTWTATDSVTYYAIYDPNTYNVTFDANGGSFADGTTTQVSAVFNTKITAPTTEPTWAGHAFAGWATTNDAAAALTELPTLTTEGTTLYAVWAANQYVIHFDSNGGTAVEDLHIGLGDAVVLPEEPAKIGNTFVGWDIDGDGVKDDIPATMPNIGDNGAEITLTAVWSVNQYKLVFDLGEGTAEGAVDGKVIIEQDYNSDVTSPVPTREGYIFTGWEPAVPNKMPVTPEEGDTYTAVWTVETYTIHFNSNGGSYVEDIVASYGETLTEPADPTKTGNTFAGWYADEDLTIPLTFVETMPDLGDNGAEMTVYAKWTVNKYTITFDLDGGTAEGAVDGKVEVTLDYGTAITAPEVSKVGYTPAGWTPDVPGTMPAENMTVKAKWNINQYTITFNVGNDNAVWEDGTDSLTKTVTKNYGEDVVFNDVPVMEGYTFAGWDTTIPETMPAEPMEITATWTVEKYTINFMSEGSIVATKEYTYGVTNTDVPTTEKTGYTFAGWTVTDGGDDMFVAAGASYTTADLGDNGATINVYAKFTANEYTITYIADGETIDEFDVTFGEEIDMPEDPEKTGYTFIGWDINEDGDVDELGTMPAEDLTAVAVFEANEASVQFNANNGVDADNVTYGAHYDETIAEVIAANSPAQPVREGYTFAGWSRSATATTADADLGKVDSDTAPVVIYAAWAINSYDIVYKAEGQADETISVVYGSAIAKPETDPVKAGYSFVGWTYADAEGTAYTDATMPAKALTATAVFEAVDQTLTFNTMGGSAIAPKQVPTDAAIADNLPAEPTRAGYTFIGWALSETATEAENLGVMPAGGTTIYAVWETGVTEYTIETYVMDKDGNYDEENPVIETATYESDAVVTITPDVEEGFAVDEDLSVLTGTVSSTDGLTLKVYVKRETYTVTFNADGGVLDGEAEVTVRYGAEIPVPAASRTGYAFAGWDAEIPAAMPAEDLEFIALWAANTIVVKYYNGSEIIEIDVAEYDSAYTLLEVNLGDEKVTEWTVNGETVAAGTAINITTTTAIKAVAKTIVPAGEMHKATFVVDGETVSAVEYAAGAAIVAPADPTKTGATFLGWDKEVGTMGDEDITFTAIFAANTATVSFTSDGVEIEKIDITVGEAIDTPDVEKTGNTLLGWDIDGDGVADELGVMPAEGFTANAVWEVNEYTITYISEGETIDELDVAYGADLDTPEDPEKTGYAFTGWAYADADGNAYTGAKMPAFDLTATAKFDAINVKVTYVLNGELVATDIATYDVDYTVLGYTDGVYNITEWTYNGATYTEGTTFVSATTEPIVFTASTLEDEHTLTLLANEGTFENNTDTYEISLKEGVVVSADELPVPVREGYTFTGWENLPDTMPYADVTATATWGINTYTVTYKIIYTKNNEVDAEKAVEDYTTVDTQAYGSTLDLPEAPEVENYNFLGWYTEYSADSKVTASDATQVTGDMTVYAVMNLGLVPVTFVVDGTAVKTIQIVPGSELAGDDFPADPEKEYYYFSGWYDATEDGNAYEVGSVVNEALTIYAQFARYAVKLVPVEGSTTMIERDGVIESYNEGYDVTIDGYETPENFETYFIYGLELAMTAEKLANYITVYGDGYYTVDTELSGGAYGTGAVIKVYDRNGTPDTADDTLVEQLYIVIFGDIDGDSRLSATDSALMDGEVLAKSWSMGEGLKTYRLKAADLDHDNRISATDSALEDGEVIVNGRNVDQVKGTAYSG